MWKPCCSSLGTVMQNLPCLRAVPLGRCHRCPCLVARTRTLRWRCGVVRNSVRRRLYPVSQDLVRRHPCVISLTSRLFERSVDATRRVPDLLKLLFSQGGRPAKCFKRSHRAERHISCQTLFVWTRGTMRCCDAFLFHLVQAFLSASSMARFRISSSACDFVNSGLSSLAKGSLRARPTPSVNCIEVGTLLFLQSHTHLDSLPAVCGCSRINIFLAVSGEGGVESAQ